jgi:6-phosphogluconolactonase (cycloisomerase 2 family)
LASSDEPGAVYTLTNASSGNAVAVFARSADGTLSAAGTVSTGGLGTGAGLGSQGALALSDGARWLFAVNAGSNSISSLRVTHDGLALVSTASSGGQTPISLAVHGDLLYVLNAGGSGNITGFIVSSHGELTPLASSTRPLGGSTTGPAEVSFSPRGDVLVVTEKAANVIATYTVGANGLTSGPVAHASSGATPFGFAFDKDGTLLVSEASGGASSYAVGRDGSVQTITASATTHQAAPCWLVVNGDGKFAYTANAGSGSLSGFSVGHDGALSLLTPSGQTGVTGNGSHPIDLAFSGNSRYLYALTTGNGGIAGFRVQADGSLVSRGAATGVPTSAAGLVAR